MSTSTSTVATSTNTSNTSANPALVAVCKKWVGVQSGTAALRWKFATELLAFSTENPSVSQVEIGAQLALAENRERGPYSAPFVSKVLGAARAYPECPKTVEDAAKFNALFDGRGPVANPRKKTGEKMSAADALKAAIRFAHKAVELGQSDSDVITAIVDALTGATVQVDAAKTKSAERKANKSAAAHAKAALAA